MTTRSTIQSTNSSFSDPLTVHPWKVLVENICSNLDKKIFEKFLFYSKEVLGEKKYDELLASDSYVNYFSSLEDACGKDGAVDHIDHIVNIEELHGNQGQTDYSHEIKRYREEKLRYLEECAKKGLTIDPDFVGRELMVEEILGYLRGNYKGVVICGMGGVGKTALAGQICYRMKFCEAKWIIIPTSQREINNPDDFLLDLVMSLGSELNVDEQTFSTNTSTMNLKCQLQSLFDMIRKDRKNILFLVDNIDDMVCTEDRKQDFNQLMRDILHMTSVDVGVKFLITSRVKMSKPTEQSKDKVHLFNKFMIELELKPFTEAESARMLRRLSHSTEEKLPDAECDQISSLCDGVPLAISIVAGQIKDGVPVQRLIGYMQYQPQSACLNNIVTQTLDKIDKIADWKTLLVRLTVFETAAFDIKACTAVCKQKQDPEREIFGYSFGDKAEQDRRWYQLAKLKSYFLLEIDHMVVFRKQRDQTKETYSLHPIIHDYLKSLYKVDQVLNQEREMAKQNFLGYFCKLIVRRGEKCDKSLGDIRQFVENSKVHIKNWFNTICKEKLPLSAYLNEDKQAKPYLVTCNCIMKISKLVLNHREKALFAIVQADISKSEKHLFSYMFWKCVEVECKIFDSRLQLAEEVLDKLTTELGIVSNETQCAFIADWKHTPEDEIPVWGKFYYTKSLLYHRKCRNEHQTELLDRAMEIVTIADEIFSRKDHKSSSKLTKSIAKCFLLDRADVKNLRGCIYFLQNKLSEAKKLHQSALDIVKKYNDRHSILLEYQCNVASCDHQLGLKSKIPEEKNRLLDEALGIYSNLVGMNKRLLQGMSLSQAGILRNRADIYYLQSRLDKALSDGKCVLNIVNKHYTPPHIELTLALERVAHYHLKIGKQMQKNLDEGGQRHLEDSVEYYDRALTYIIKGGLPVEHCNGRTFRITRDNHAKALTLLKYSKGAKDERMRKYQNFLDGKYNRNIQQSLLHDPDFISEEFLRECRESGKTFIPERVDSDTESDSDTDDTESESESSSETTTSDSNESMVIENPEDDRNESQTVVLHRRDSGIEEESIGIVLDELNQSHGDEDIPPDEAKTESEEKVDNLNPSRKSGQVIIEDDTSKSHRKGILKRQMNIDVSDKEASPATKTFLSEYKQASNSNVGPIEAGMISSRASTSTSFHAHSAPASRNVSGSSSSEVGSDMSHRSTTSSTSTRKDTWTSFGSQDSTFGDVVSHGESDVDSLFEEVERRQRILSSSGSQNSVTSKMGQMLNLHSVDDQKDDNDVTEPVTKLSKLDPESMN